MTTAELNVPQIYAALDSMTPEEAEAQYTRLDKLARQALLSKDEASADALIACRDKVGAKIGRVVPVAKPESGLEARVATLEHVLDRIGQEIARLAGLVEVNHKPMVDDGLDVQVNIVRQPEPKPTIPDGPKMHDAPKPKFTPKGR